VPSGPKAGRGDVVLVSVGTMSWFRRSPDDDADAPSEEPATGAVPPAIEPLTAEEIAWVRSNIAGLIQDVRLNDIEDLGRHYDELLDAWVRLDESRRPDPHEIITQIGLGFGQYVADRAKLDWTVATDEHGPEIALHRVRGNVLIYPTDVVAKRWAAQERQALPGLARQMIATVEQIP
jgi:hypothetical protein